MTSVIKSVRSGRSCPFFKGWLPPGLLQFDKLDFYVKVVMQVELNISKLYVLCKSTEYVIIMKNIKINVCIECISSQIIVKLI